MLRMKRYSAVKIKLHEKVLSGENKVIDIVVQRTYHGIKQNKNQLKILSSFRDNGFLLEKLKPQIF